MKSIMGTLIGWSIGWTIVISITLVTYAGAWGVWGSLLSFLWPSGPESLIAPGFWVFVAYMLASIPVNLLLGGVFEGIRDAVNEEKGKYE